MLLKISQSSFGLQSLGIVLLSFATLFQVALSGPIRQLPTQIVKGQDHQIDNMNEIHHDVDVDAGKNPDLAMDMLPDQAADKDYAGDRQLNNEEQRQQQQLPDQAGPDVRNAKKDLDFDISLARKVESKKLAKEKLMPVDHMDVVRLEQDGHVNKDYHKEMFLGGQHDEFKDETLDHPDVKLKEIVHRADLDGDGYLSKDEMEKWILRKMDEHFEEAKKENELIFEHLDPDGNGLIKWKEYYLHFLLSRGFNAENAMQHLQDYDDTIHMGQDDTDALVSYKFRWTDADGNSDNQLTKEEFMVFRHPEHSQKSLDIMVNNVMRGVDTDEDGVITMEEFAALPPGEVEGAEFQEMDKKWQEERKAEFKDIMDENKDGKVDLREMKNYLDPTNPVQAKLEADTLLSLLDDNKDGRLSIDEILKHSDIFISSKLVNFAANVHDEF